MRCPRASFSQVLCLAVHPRGSLRVLELSGSWGLCGEGTVLSLHPRIVEEHVYALSSCQQLAFQVNIERIFKDVKRNIIKENVTTLMWPGSHIGIE